MDKERLKELAGNPKFTSGIYNYCDRWCERCQFTSRCLNFAVSEEHFDSSDKSTRNYKTEGANKHDLNNAEFWEKLHEMLQITRDMINEMAEREGIDLNAIDEEEFKQREKLREEVVENHECAVMGQEYIDLVNEWFESSDELFEKRAEELNLKVSLELPNENPVEEANILSDSIEIIRWYQHQIYVKTSRALHGQIDEEDELLEDFPKDSDGSAKVALIGIDRSIVAWGILHSNFPEQEDSTLKILLHLERLRKKIESTFPSARAFVRPGFDEMDTYKQD